MMFDKGYIGEKQAGLIESKQSPQLMTQMASLEKSIHTLRDSLGQLGERLLPISYAVPETETNYAGVAAPRPRPTSPLVDRLQELESMLWAMNRRVQTQLESMDL